ncbi:MAG: undecaprenyldiphospho-muramoylpentapeptide beta-N-acetylglucosaminyltransferase [Alphaproteobacteria bacterium]
MTAYVLAAGGTGGHVFPAQALARELSRRGRRVVVMTDARSKNYGEVFPGAEIATVPSATFADRSAPGRLAALGIIAVGVLSAFAKLLRLKPNAVVGFGGYPSLPVMTAAWLAGMPTLVHEQNAVPGRVNRLLVAKVKRISASLPFVRYAPKDSTRVVVTGNPVRPEAAALANTGYTPPDVNGAIRLLVFGGSQGARVLSEIVPAALARLPAELRARLEVTQQCRPEDVVGVQESYRASAIRHDVAHFYDDLPTRMARAHLVICRSGASTVSELAVIGRPAVLVPYPFAMDDHQAANAAVMERAGAAWHMPQHTLTPEVLAAFLADVFDAPAELAKRAKAARALGRPDAALRLADLVETLGKEAA